MTDPSTSGDQALEALHERAKELICLYAIDEILSDQDAPLSDLFEKIVLAMPGGWRQPAFCQAMISYRGTVHQSYGFQKTPWEQQSPILVQGEQVGKVLVSYTLQMPQADEGPFLKEERKLINTIAERLGQAILHRDLRNAFEQLKSGKVFQTDAGRHDWRIILELLKSTDLNLFRRITRKMLNHLSYQGTHEAKELMLRLSAERSQDAGSEIAGENRPMERAELVEAHLLAEETFRIAEQNLSEQGILSLIQTWIKEDRVKFLVQVLETADSSLIEIAGAMERYRYTGVDARELSKATQEGLKTSLVRRLLTEHLDFIETARKSLEIEDFYDLLSHTILLPKSHGKLGGKSSGLFLASKILGRSVEHADLLSGIRIPKTWYLPSDVLLQFLAHNGLDDLYNWKYLDIDQIRQEYPHILHVFQHSHFAPEIVQGLSTALDDLGDCPLIVRSSSLLEDSIGSAFSGKYKSLFLANQGDRATRLAALLDAIAEVYASVFGPDPIQYRAERGLLDQHEEMAIMIQEVVGTRVSHFFFPAYAGVGFSNNELRWSPRIKREDGLLRMVPGLGTRAVDRLADDYTVLVSPGQPGLRVNAAPEETLRYSPRNIDVIDLQANAFRTMDIDQLLEEVRDDYPAFRQLVSVFDDNRLRSFSNVGEDVNPRNILFTFEELISRTRFMTQMQTLLSLLRETLHTPVDIEFASNGQDFYLLQCRPQSYSEESAPSPIPRDLPPNLVLFSANRYVTNGKVPDITHLVYVDPDGYSQLRDLASMRNVGRAVSALNKILPRRRFILMGPGRWGSRGDIHLGVNVTYSDINNAAVLVEIARKRGNYVPDLSFGTHFFQDLVESGIRYLPLYPDDPGVIFQESFFMNSKNILVDLLPEFAHLSKTIIVLGIPEVADGRVLRLLMNADQDEAVAILAPAGIDDGPAIIRSEPVIRQVEDHSGWRYRMARRIAGEMDPVRFGVKGFYLIGSTKNGTAGAGADIDVVLHVADSAGLHNELQTWLEGWSLCLAEMNYLRTGVERPGLLDVRLVTDDDIARQLGFAAKIGAVTDPAKPLPLRSSDMPE
jgi:pyruvate, water dikinase